MQYDDGVPVAEPCPKCGSTQTYEVKGEIYWKCESCSTVWFFEDESAPRISDREPYIVLDKKDTVNVSGLDFEV
jgi:transposase-like protein